MDQFKRRQRLDLCSRAELSIFEAVEEVEKLAADERLTNAIVKLTEARNLVADWVDENKPPVIQSQSLAKEALLKLIKADKSVMGMILFFEKDGVIDKITPTLKGDMELGRFADTLMVMSVAMNNMAVELRKREKLEKKPIQLNTLNSSTDGQPERN